MTPALIAMDLQHFDSVYGGEVWDALSQRVRWTAPPQSAEQLRQDPSPLAEVEVLFTSWGAPVLDAELLALAPQLKVVFHAAGSVRPIVTPAFWRRNVTITHAAAVNATPTAQFCASAIVLSLKHVWRTTQYVRTQAAFPNKDSIPGIYRSTVGLISLGAVGQIVARHLAAYDLNLLAYDPLIDPDRAASLGVRLCSLEKLFQQCEVVSLHTPLLEETRGLITGALLASMRPEATFINTARGAVVNEAEMIEVLRKRSDLTAVLDVTDPEPPVPGSPLYSLPNVVLTPHIAGSHGRECRRLGQCMVEEFDRYAAGSALHYSLSEARAVITA